MRIRKMVIEDFQLPNGHIVSLEVNYAAGVPFYHLQPPEPSEVELVRGTWSDGATLSQDELDVLANDAIVYDAIVTRADEVADEMESEERRSSGFPKAGLQKPT